jgi:hypothetical protein
VTSSTLTASSPRLVPSRIRAVRHIPDTRPGHPAATAMALVPPVGCKFAIRAVSSHDVRRPRRFDETLCAAPTPPPRAIPSANGGPHGIVYATQLGLDCPLFAALHGA